ncbi:MAG: DNA repair protein RadC [Clostridiales bacterium]|nr:DNA repair protein RadC [Clostridiales bacterium]
MKIKDIPNSDRPYERCLKYGPEILSDAELLSIIIRTGSRNVNSMELAGQILALNYPKEGILGLLHLSLQDLTAIRGIGTVKAVQLLCIGELSRRIWKEHSVDLHRQFTSPEVVFDYYREDMRHLEKEQMRMMLFNTRQVLIREVLISQGTVNASLASPREILIEALRSQAVNLILVHNHPSGDAEPSLDDIALTQKIAEAGNLIGIPMIDHVVIGDHSYVSLKERGYI